MKNCKKVLALPSLGKRSVSARYGKTHSGCQRLWLYNVILTAARSFKSIFQDYVVFIEQPLFVEGQSNGLRSACAGGSNRTDGSNGNPAGEDDQTAIYHRLKWRRNEMVKACYFSLYTDYNCYSTITSPLCLRSVAKEMHDVRFNLSVILWQEARLQAGIEPRSFTSQVQWTTWPLDPALPGKLNIFIWLESRTCQGPFWQYINNLSSP